jgi:LEA14-like dessication related protein
MKRSKVFKFLLAFALVVIVGISILFYFYNPRKAIDLILPDISSITYINADVKDDSVHTKIDVIVQNKSPYKLTIDSVFFEIKLNDKQLVEETVPIELKQQRYQVDTVQLPVNISREKLKRILESLKHTDSTDISTNCYVIYNTVFGHVKLKYDQTKHIAVPIPPKIKVVKVERKRYSLVDKTLYATVELEIINRGRNINIQLNNIKYQFQVENSLSSEGSIDKTVTVAPGSTEHVEVPIAVKVEHPLKTAVAIITDNDVMNYTLHLTADIIENMTDKVKRGPIPAEVNASGVLELKK